MNNRLRDWLCSARLPETPGRSRDEYPLCRLHPLPPPHSGHHGVLCLAFAGNRAGNSR